MEKSVEMLPAIQRMIRIDAPIERVRNAVATSEGLAAWFMPTTSAGRRARVRAGRRAVGPFPVQGDGGRPTPQAFLINGTRTGRSP